MRVPKRHAFASLALAWSAVMYPPLLQADPILPTSFASLGAYPTTAGNYTVDTTSGSTPTLTGPGGTYSGVVYQDTPGHSLAIFTFDFVDLTAQQTLTTVQASNPSKSTLPFVLLSKTDITIEGAIKLGYPYFSPDSGPTAGGSKSGPGAGSNGQSYAINIVDRAVTGGGGGGFGSRGRDGDSYTFPGSNPNFTLPGGIGGSPYGNIIHSLVGGSGGGSSFPGQGGWGGGAVEIGATNSIKVTGTVDARGGAGDYPDGGGGSGGAIFLHAADVALIGKLEASGGAGGPGDHPFPDNFTAGGAGGGGQIAIEYNHDLGGSFTNTGTIDAGGGFVQLIGVPEPPPLTLAAVAAGLVGIARLTWSARKQLANRPLTR